MYLYIAFFSEDALNSGRFYSSGISLELIKQKMPNYINLQKDKIKGCIAYIRGKDYSMMNPYIIYVKNITANDYNLEINYELIKEIGVTNEQLGKQIYRYSRENGMIDNDIKFPPNLLILDKVDFDKIRKGQINARRITSKTAKIDEFKLKNDWKSIVDIFEPLENLENTEDWNNEIDLSELAFACSKLSELKNGMEKDNNHLNYIKKYREYCLKIYERCININPNKYRYKSGIAYRHYQNVFELTRQKGRKDGNVKEEIDKALFWFDRSLEIYPLNIKDLGRKGYLILDIKLNNMKNTNKNWTREFYLELNVIEDEGMGCLYKVLEVYDGLDENYKKRHKKDYIKSLYRLSKYRLKKVNDLWNEYSCNKILGKPIILKYDKLDYSYILSAQELMKKCIMTITDYSIEDLEHVKEEIFKEEYWNGSPIDMLYHVGEIYFNMYFVKIHLNRDYDKTDEYRQYSLYYYNEAIKAGHRMKKQGTSNRSTWFVTERIARINIIDNNYKKAVQLLERARASYIKNTLAVALLIEGTKENIAKAKQVLKELSNDKYNLADGLTMALLIYTYKLEDEFKEIDKLIQSKSKSYEKAQKYLGFLNVKEVTHES